MMQYESRPCTIADDVQMWANPPLGYDLGTSCIGIGNVVQLLAHCPVQHRFRFSCVRNGNIVRHGLGTSCVGFGNVVRLLAHCLVQHRFGFGCIRNGNAIWLWTCRRMVMTEEPSIIGVSIGVQPWPLGLALHHLLSWHEGYI